MAYGVMWFSNTVALSHHGAFILSIVACYCCFSVSCDFLGASFAVVGTILVVSLY